MTNEPQFLTPLRDTDAPASRSDCNDNRCHTHAPCPSRLRLRIHRQVHIIPFLLQTCSDRCHCSAFDTLQNGGPPVSRIEWTPASQSTVRRIEVTMHKTNEQYPTSQSSQHGSFVGKEKRHDSLNTNDSIVGHEMGEGRDGKSLTPV